MTQKNDKNIDIERYLNDPAYRRQRMNEKKSASETNQHNKGRFFSFSRFSHKDSMPGQSKKKSNQKSSYTNWLYFLLGSIAVFIIGFIIFLFQGLPSIEELENPQTDIASFVMSRDGEVLDKYFTENRTYVTYDNISQHVIDALIAVEDHRFYDHWGIDVIRTAAIPYHLMRGNMQGGSTITQQLARNLYRKIGRRVTPTRKLREMITAIQIEKNYTKKEIIEMYLNTVEYSNSSFGIEAAAYTHYGKTAKDLNINESATLVGCLNAVTAYNPRTNPDRSTRRRNIVLSQMERRGFIDQNTFQSTLDEPIVLNYNPPFTARRTSRYFGEYIRLQIQDWADENGYDLYTDGLVIYTTVDSRMQQIAERVVSSQIDSLQRIFVNEWTSRGGDYMDRLWDTFPSFLDSFIEETDEYKNGFGGGKNRVQVLDSLKADKKFVDSVKRLRTRLEAGFVAMDPRNGHILAWVGGTDYGRYQFDHVFLSRRQAGSTFKPFVYAVAIDNGYKPYHRFSRYPTSFIDRQNRAWEPKDASLSSGPEMVSLREGFARSLNNVTVRLLPELAGAPGTNRLEDLMPAGRKIAEMARNLGVNKSPIHTLPSLALGTADVTLLEMTNAYATFANQGVRVDPIAITRIEDKNGNVLLDNFPQSREEVISPETAYIMVDMMRGVIRGGDWGIGTGVRLRAMGVNQDVGGKTGTTQNSADNWFISIMPHIVIGTWVGGEDRRIRFPQNTVIGQGARTALPIVAHFILDNVRYNRANWSFDGFEQPTGYIPDPPGAELLLDAPVNRNQRRTGW
jgi:penicillin-binding protein 1A